MQQHVQRLCVLYARGGGVRGLTLRPRARIRLAVSEGHSAFVSTITVKSMLAVHTTASSTDGMIYNATQVVEGILAGRGKFFFNILQHNETYSIIFHKKVTFDSSLCNAAGKCAQCYFTKTKVTKYLLFFLKFYLA